LNKNIELGERDIAEIRPFSPAISVPVSRHFQSDGVEGMLKGIGISNKLPKAWRNNDNELLAVRK
jgi:hypothetical protein